MFLLRFEERGGEEKKNNTALFIRINQSKRGELYV